jgi:DNA-binding CsgD family transcriptional regulator
MPDAQVSDSPPDTLSPRERAMLEFCAEGLSDREIAARLRMSRREISAIRGRAAAKLSGRIASAHPFQISEVVLDRSLDFAEL